MEENDRIPASIGEYIAGLKQTGSVIRWIWNYVASRQAKKRILFFTLSALIVTTLSILQSSVVARVFDGLVIKDSASIITAIIVFFTCAFCSKEIDRFGAKQHELIHADLSSNLNKKITQLFFEKSLGQLKAHASLFSASNIEKGKARTLELCFSIVFELIPVLMRVTISISALCFFGWPGLVMIVVLIVYTLTSLYLNFRVIQDCTQIDRDFRRVNRRFAERLEGVLRVLVCGRAKDEVKTLADEYGEVMTQDSNFWVWYIDFSKWRSRYAILSLTGVLALSAHKIWIGEWTPGLLYPVLAWATIAQDNFWQIASAERKIQWNLPSVSSMIELLMTPPWFDAAARTKCIDWSTPPTISFQSVTYRYRSSDEAQRPVLQDISFEIPAGTTCAVVGQSGSGKTTLSQLLLQFDDPASGNILINDVPLSTLSRDSLVSGLGYVPQEAIMFDGTVFENVVYGLSPERRATTSEEDVWALIRALNIDFGDRLTHGLQTRIGKNGLQLSGGQKQRLAIVAALMNDPKLIVIDEATSHLDSETERLIQDGMDAFLRTGKTVFTIAHRLSTVRNAYMIVVLRPLGEVKEGESQIEAIGTFDELLITSPTLRTFAQNQGMVMQMV